LYPSPVPDDRKQHINVFALSTITGFTPGPVPAKSVSLDELGTTTLPQFKQVNLDPVSSLDCGDGTQFGQGCRYGEMLPARRPT
jgi:hypothetical protein